MTATGARHKEPSLKREGEPVVVIRGQTRPERGYDLGGQQMRPEGRVASEEGAVRLAL